MGLEPTTAWTTTSWSPYRWGSEAHVYWVFCVSVSVSFAQIGPQIGPQLVRRLGRRRIPKSRTRSGSEPA